LSGQPTFPVRALGSLFAADWQMEAMHAMNAPFLMRRGNWFPMDQGLSQIR
jgi:hypothetical protein